MSKERMREDVVGIQQVTAYPFSRWQGKEHEYALTVDVSELNDVTKPGAKVNFVVDKKIVKSVTIQEMIQGYFDL
jgi:hypothetical protein